jgi:hypothetical protein
VHVSTLLTPYSLAHIIACTAMWMSSTSPTAPAAPRIDLTVRLYQDAGLPSALAPRALVEAGTVLLAGLVRVHWRTCTGPNMSPTCDVPPAPSELLLVLRNGTHCPDATGTLGKALVSDGGGGVATVNVNCVASVAAAARTDVAVLLGRVAAHEPGHLIMRTTTHARRGLMRPHWTLEEVRRDRAADWAFTTADVAAMRQPGTD